MIWWKHRRTSWWQKEATQPCLRQTKSATRSSVVAGDERHHFNCQLKDGPPQRDQVCLGHRSGRTSLTVALWEGNTRESAPCFLKQAAACSSWKLIICVHRSQTVLYLEDLSITAQTGLAAGISYFPPFAYFPWKSESGYYGVIYFLSSANLSAK